jgi:hypothetical protein
MVDPGIKKRILCSGKKTQKILIHYNICSYHFQICLASPDRETIALKSMQEAVHST